MGIGLALNFGHRLAGSVAGGGAGSSVLEDPNGGGIVVFDPDEVTPWGGWTDWAEMMAAILDWQTTQVDGGVAYQTARTVTIFVFLNNTGINAAIFDVPGGDYPVAGPIAVVGGPSAALGFQQLGGGAVLPTTVLRFGENGGDVSFSWAPAAILPDNPGPRFEFYGITAHSAQNAPVWTVEPRAGTGDTAGTLVIKLQDARLSAGAPGPGAMIQAGNPSLVAIFADRSIIQRSGSLSTLGSNAIPVLLAGAGSLCNIVTGDRSTVLDFAIASEVGASLEVNQDPTSLSGYFLSPSFPVDVGGITWPSIRPVLVPQQLVNNGGIPGQPQQVVGAAVVLGQVADNLGDGDTFGWSITGIPDLVWTFVLGAPATPTEVQIQGSGAATFIEWADRINLNAAAPYTAVAVTGTGINNHLIVIPKAATIADFQRPQWGGYGVTSIVLQEARFDLDPGMGGAVVQGAEYGTLEYSGVTATIPADAVVDGLGPTYGGAQQLPDGTVVRCQLPTSITATGAGFQDYRLSFGAWVPADSIDANPTHWAAPLPSNMSDAIRRLAALVYTLNGNTPIPV